MDQKDLSHAMAIVVQSVIGAGRIKIFLLL